MMLDKNTISTDCFVTLNPIKLRDKQSFVFYRQSKYPLIHLLQSLILNIPDSGFPKSMQHGIDLTCLPLRCYASIYSVYFITKL